MVAAGIGPMIAAVPLALTAVTLVGAIYLIVLGIGVLQAPRPDVGSLASSDAAEAALTAPNGRSMIRQGATVSALNAKSLVLFVVFLPRFVSAAASLPLWVQLVTLGLTWAAMAPVLNVFLGVAARRLFKEQPDAAGIISRITGIAMVAMGLWVIGERIWALAVHPGWDAFRRLRPAGSAERCASGRGACCAAVATTSSEVSRKIPRSSVSAS